MSVLTETVRSRAELVEALTSPETIQRVARKQCEIDGWKWAEVPLLHWAYLRDAEAVLWVVAEELS